MFLSNRQIGGHNRPSYDMSNYNIIATKDAINQFIKSVIGMSAGSDDTWLAMSVEEEEDRRGGGR